MFNCSTDIKNSWCSNTAKKTCLHSSYPENPTLYFKVHFWGTYILGPSSSDEPKAWIGGISFLPKSPKSRVIRAGPTLGGIIQPPRMSANGRTFCPCTNRSSAFFACITENEQSKQSRVTGRGEKAWNQKSRFLHRFADVFWIQNPGPLNRRLA